MGSQEHTWITVKAAANYAAYDVATIYRWCKAGHFAYFKPGPRNASIRIERASFYTFIQQHTVPAYET